MAARGVHATILGSGLDALVALGRTNPGAVIVAPSLSDVSAEDVIRRVRQHSVAVVVAVVGTDGIGATGALIRVGASTLISRPYDSAALWAAVGNTAHPLDEHARVSYGTIELDAAAYVVAVHGERLNDLPLKEFELLRALMYHAPDVVTNAELRATVWGESPRGVTDNAIGVHVHRLRMRLDAVACIRRVRGRGYALTLL